MNWESFSRKEMLDLARRVKRFRKKHGLFQRQLAALLGVTRRTVINIEQRSHITHAKILDQLATLEKQFDENKNARREMKGLMECRKKA